MAEVQEEIEVVSIATVPEEVIGPPVKPAPEATEVTVPAFPEEAEIVIVPLVFDIVTLDPAAIVLYSTPVPLVLTPST